VGLGVGGFGEQAQGSDPLAEPVLVTEAAGVAVRADAAWLISVTSAAAARTTADRIIRGLPRAAWMIFI